MLGWRVPFSSNFCRPIRLACSRRQRSLGGGWIGRNAVHRLTAQPRCTHWACPANLLFLLQPLLAVRARRPGTRPQPDHLNGHGPHVSAPHHRRARRADCRLTRVSDDVTGIATCALLGATSKKSPALCMLHCMALWRRETSDGWTHSALLRCLVDRAGGDERWLLKQQIHNGAPTGPGTGRPVA